MKESEQRWCVDGLSSAVMTEPNCESRLVHADFCDSEALRWAFTRTDSAAKQPVGMLVAVERHFGSELPTSPVEWLTDNGS